MISRRRFEGHQTRVTRPLLRVRVERIVPMTIDSKLFQRDQPFSIGGMMSTAELTARMIRKGEAVLMTVVIVGPEHRRRLYGNRAWLEMRVCSGKHSLEMRDSIGLEIGQSFEVTERWKMAINFSTIFANEQELTEYTGRFESRSDPYTGQSLCCVSSLSSHAWFSTSLSVKVSSSETLKHAPFSSLYFPRR